EITDRGGTDMHRVRVVRSYYEQSAPYVGRVGEVIGHWGPDNNEEGRDGFMVQLEDGTILGVSENEVESVTDEEGTEAAEAAE
ncbi:MAG TPA: hypothetical protein VF584_25440, partial [Longimicrobium sp.]